MTNCAYPTGMDALGGNNYDETDNTVTNAYATDEVNSAVVAVFASADSRSAAPNGTAAITLTAEPGHNVSNLSVGSINYDGSIVTNAVYDGSGTITLTTGAAEGTTEITFDVTYEMTDFAGGPVTQSTVTLSVPVTVVDKVEIQPGGDSSTGGDSGGGGGGCSAGFGALALLAIAPLALKRRK